MIDTILLSILVLGVFFLEWRASRSQKLLREIANLLRHVAEAAIRERDRLAREAAESKRSTGKD